jgi:hypothetical protein
MSNIVGITLNTFEARQAIATARLFLRAGTRSADLLDRARDLSLEIDAMTLEYGVAHWAVGSALVEMAQTLRDAMVSLPTGKTLVVDDIADALAATKTAVNYRRNVTTG